MKIAVVGATGLVGRKILEIIEERNIQFTELIPVASEKSVGKKIRCNGREWIVVSLPEAVELKPDVALFSAGGETSLQWAEAFAKNGSEQKADKLMELPELYKTSLANAPG